jgi:hypothetical protein
MWALFCLFLANQVMLMFAAVDLDDVFLAFVYIEQTVMRMTLALVVLGKVYRRVW